MKKTNKKIKIKHFFSLIFFASILAVFFSNVKVINAQIGGVPVVTTGSGNDLNIIFDPVQPSQYQSVKVTVSLKDTVAKNTNGSLSLTNVGTTVKLFTCSNSAQNCQNSVFVTSYAGVGRSLTWTFVVNPQTLKVGQNNIQAQFSTTANQVSGISFFSGNAQLTVLAGNTSGPATLAISESNQVLSGTTQVIKTFDLIFNPGSAATNATKFTLDCGNNSQPVRSAGNQFDCAYNITAQTYTVTGVAWDGSNNQLAKGVFSEVITGNEATTGSGSEKLNQPNAFSGLLNFLNEFINLIVGLIQELIFFIFTFLIEPLLETTLSIRTYTDQFAAVIYPGWQIVRNLCNILFIVALIAIAMGTLLRLEKYQYKNLLVQLIIAALLVNFSLFVGQAVLGVADTVQNQFLPNNRTVIRSLARDLMVRNHTVITNAFTSGLAGEGYFSNTVKPLFGLIVTTGTFMVFVAIAVYLCIRIVMLWILLMVSPIAYAAGALPSTAHYREEWWGKFLQYAFFTPVMAFCLNMAAVILNGQSTNDVLKQLAGTSAIQSVASNILLLIFLLAALSVAEKFSIIGADSVTKFAKQGMLAPAAGGKLLGGYIGRKYSDFTVNTIRGHAPKVSVGRSVLFAIANPKAVIKGFQKRSEELQHAAHEKAEAAGLEVVEQRLTGGRKVIPRVLTHEKAEEDKFAKDFSHLNREGVVRTAMDILQLKDNDEGKAMKRAIIKLAMDKGYIDDIVQDGARKNSPEGRAFIKKLYEAGIVDMDAKNWKKDWDEVEEMNEETGKLEKRKRLKHDDRQRRAMYKAFFGEHGHIHDQAALRLITEEGEDSGKKTGHFEYLKDGKKDIKTGMYELREDEEYEYDENGNLQYWEDDGEQNGVFHYKGDPKVLMRNQKEINAAKDSDAGRAFAAAEVAKMGDRAQAAAAYHSFISLASQGKIVDQRFIKAVARAIIGNPGFMQQRTSPNVIFGQGAMSTQQKKYFQEHNGRVLIDRETYKALRQIANVDGGGGVLAGMYSMGVYEKRDDKLIGSIMRDNGITFDVVDKVNGVDTIEKDVKLQWKPQQKLKLETEDPEQVKEKKQQDNINKQIEINQKILEALEKMEKKL